MQHKGLLQQLQTAAAAEIPSQPRTHPDLLPSLQKHPLAQQYGGTGAGLVQQLLLVPPDLLQQPHKQNADSNTGRTESWGEGGEWDHFFC